MIIERALTREVVQTGGAVTLVLMSIFLVVRLVGFLREAAGGDIPVDSVLSLLLLKLVTYVDVILPLMLYIAVLMVLGRWNRDNELTVLAACGVGLGQLLRPLSFLMTGVAALVALFSLYLAPLSVRSAERIEQAYQQRSEITGVVPGVFMETRRGTGVYFVERYDPSTDSYTNVFVYNSSFNKEGVVVAKTGFQRLDELTGDKFLVLRNGTRYEGNPGEPDYRVLEFERYAIRIEDSAPVEPVVPVKGMTNRELLATDEPRLATEFQWRLSKPVVIPALVLFALGFSQLSPRSSRLPAMLAAFIVYFLYTNLLGFAVALMHRGRLDPTLGLWWIHAAFLLAGLYVFARRSRSRSLIPGMRLRYG